VLHGYHVQITARSSADLDSDTVLKKISDASGAKYTAGGSAPVTSAPPPVAKKPVFTPTASSSGANPLVAARNRKQDVDDDGWGADAPPVTRTQLEKVESAYRPTKVNMAELSKHPQPAAQAFGYKKDNGPSDVIGGSYQPVGKVDIAAIRASAKNPQDDRPTLVKGAYEPVGKVDIAAIRAKAQKPASDENEPAPSRSLADRSAAFSQPTASERMTSMPKPKVANKFGAAAAFTGTKAPTPGGLGFGGPSVPTAAPVGAASRTFADQGGKTPAQIWAEKKARQTDSSSTISPPVTSPITAQRSGSEWKSDYAGKKWGTVQTSNFGRGGLAVEEQRTGEGERGVQETPESPSGGGGVSALRDRFKGAAPMGQSAPSIPRATTGDDYDEPAPPPPPSGSRPGGGFQLPGLPSRPPPPTDEEEEEMEIPQREESPPRVAVPVPRIPEPELEPPAERLPARPIPVPDVPEEEDLPEEQATYNQAREAATHVAADSLGHAAVASGQADRSGGKRALIQYDYERAEDNEIELREGEFVTNIEMVDDDWWMGTNSAGESGLFPSNYVELVEDGVPEAGGGHAEAPPPPAQVPAPAAAPAAEPASGGGPTATAQFDYEAAEDNGMYLLSGPAISRRWLTMFPTELSFPENAKITNLEFPDEDWWFGHYGGASGLFPANYVQLDQ
jgi:drebrin-like protein